jgi:hypothetical protein
MLRREFGIHRAIAEAVTSDEAERVTPNICAIYYRLLSAPEDWWEEKEILHIKVKSQNGVLTPAWSALVAHLRVPPETARRALQWLDEEDIITFKSSANGREIRISFEGLYFPEDKPQG